MSELRPFAILRDGDQWMRCAFDRCFLDHEQGIIELAWQPLRRDVTTAAPTAGAGLAFDAECRLYHTRPLDGQVERVQWSADAAPGAPAAAWPSFRNPSGMLGDFTPSGAGGP